MKFTQALASTSGTGTGKADSKEIVFPHLIQRPRTMRDPHVDQALAKLLLCVVYPLRGDVYHIQGGDASSEARSTRCPNCGAQQPTIKVLASKGNYRGLTRTGIPHCNGGARLPQRRSLNTALGRWPRTPRSTTRRQSDNKGHSDEPEALPDERVRECLLGPPGETLPCVPGCSRPLGRRGMLVKYAAPPRTGPTLACR